MQLNHPVITQIITLIVYQIASCSVYTVLRHTHKIKLSPVLVVFSTVCKIYDVYREKLVKQSVDY